MINLFTHSKNNPVLKPDPNHDWENLKVYNPGAIYEDGVYHLFYRAMGRGWPSTIGYAASKDGENFTKSEKPIFELKPKNVEDPRITKIGNAYFLTYTLYDGLFVTLSLAISKDAKNWQERGEMIPNWDLQKAGGFLVKWDPAQVAAESNPLARKKWSKAGAIFPQIIDGKYWMLFGDRNIWLATSTDGINWNPVWEPFLKPRHGNYFDGEHVEMGPPPIKTEKGWLILYHGVNKTIEYKLGFALLDLDNPARIVFRSDEPIFQPEEPYELSGIVDILPGGYKVMKKMTKKSLKNSLRKTRRRAKCQK